MTAATGKPRLGKDGHEFRRHLGVAAVEKASFGKRPYRHVLNLLLNPFFSNPGAKVGLPLSLRLARAFAISARNVTYFVFIDALLIRARHMLPMSVVIALVLGVAGLLYLRIRRIERRGDEVPPVYFLGLFLALFMATAFARSVADSAFHARYAYVIDSERFLFGTVPSIWLQGQLYSAAHISLLDIGAIAVYLSYFAMPIFIAIGMWHSRPDAFRFYLLAFGLCMLLGTIYMTAVPTAPPWLAGQEGHISEVHRIVRIAANRLVGGSYDQGYNAVGADDVATMPSFHMAETLIVIWSLRRYWRLPLSVCYAYSFAMGFALVYLGEHYVVDLLAGAGLAGFCWLIASRLTESPAAARLERPTSLRPVTEGGASFELTTL